MGLVEINKLIQNGSFEKAIESIKDYRKQNPGELLSNYYLGYCYYELKKFENCVLSLREVIDRAHPDEFDSIPAYAFFYLGMAQVRLGLALEGKKNMEIAYQQLDEEFSSNEGKLKYWVELNYFLGKASIHLGSIEEGHNYIQFILNYFDESGCPDEEKNLRFYIFSHYYSGLVFYMLEDFSECRRILIKAANILEKSLSKIKILALSNFFYPLYVIGKSLIITEEYKRGLPLLLAAKKFTSDPEPLLILDYYQARCYLKLGDYTRARKIINSLTERIAAQELEIDPDYIVNIFFTSGQVSLQEKNYKQALKEFQRALKLDPELEFINNIIADLFLILKNKAKARTHYRQALKLDPGDIYAHIRIIQSKIFSKKQSKSSTDFFASIDFSKSKFPMGLEKFLKSASLFKEKIATKQWWIMFWTFMSIWEKNLFQYFDDPIE
ncbi:tetratricopeptide repeat protein [Candidatus Riflebacteria bacterium]